MLQKSIKNVLNSKGFTLVELAVVMFIMGLIAAAAVPNLEEAHARRSLQTSALQMQQEIRTLGQISLQREAAGYYIKFNISGDYYTIYGPGTARTVKLPPGVDIIATNYDINRINFATRGVPTAGGHISLYSPVIDEFKYVIIAAVTGRTRVSDAPPGSPSDM